MNNKERCFYCDTLISNNSGSGDHFPIPKDCGGKTTVPACLSCHDMKDRFKLNDWPFSWTTKIIEDFPKLQRESKLLLAKMIATFVRHLNSEKMIKK